MVATVRIVWGDLFKGTPKLDDNDQPAASANPHCISLTVTTWGAAVRSFGLKEKLCDTPVKRSSHESIVKKVSSVPEGIDD